MHRVLAAGGPRDRAGGEVEGVQLAGLGRRHGAGELTAQTPGGQTELRDGDGDPRGPRAGRHPASDEQPGQDHCGGGEAAARARARAGADGPVGVDGHQGRGLEHRGGGVSPHQGGEDGTPPLQAGGVACK